VIKSIQSPEPATSEQFAQGQVWVYKTRPGEEASRAPVGGIETAAEVGTIVHVNLTGLRIKNPAMPGGFSSVISHAPISELALSASVTELTKETSDLDGFREGYDSWLSSFCAGDAGVFSIPLSQVVEFIEQTLAKGA
jgi:hypothetical protein